MKLQLSKLLQAAIALLAIPGSVAACAPFNYVGRDSPRALLHVAPLEPRPRVALVLSSGGPRGYAHIGVMRVLEEAGIDIDLIVGTSVGSLLGAFWADGKNAAEIDALSQTGGPFTLFDLSLFADRGWIRGQRLQDYVSANLVHKRIEQMPRRLIVGATRRSDKTPVFFTSGNAGVAVRASSAVPRVISPVGIDGTEYEDGDESLPLAVRAARQAGAQFVIAVDVTPRPETVPFDGSQAQRSSVLRRSERIAPEAALADYVINAELKFAASPRPSYFRYARMRGEQSARAQLPLLLDSLQRTGRTPQPTPATLEMVAMDYALRVPPTAQSGLVRIGLRNTGAKLHHAQLFRLTDGKRLADVYTEITKTGGIATLPSWAIPAGGPSAALPGARIEVEQRLAPGRYAVICWIPAPDGQPHYAKGMIAEFEVRGPAAVAAAPQADLSATLREYAVDMPVVPTRGKKRIHVRNAGKHAHEFLIVRLAAGQQLRDVASWSEHGQTTSPPPAEMWSGVAALAPGGEAWLEVNFTPGRYALFCLNPDTGDKRPHMMHGMVREFTVQ